VVIGLEAFLSTANYVAPTQIDRVIQAMEIMSSKFSSEAAAIKKRQEEQSSRLADLMETIKSFETVAADNVRLTTENRRLVEQQQSLEEGMRTREDILRNKEALLDKAMSWVGEGEESQVGELRRSNRVLEEDVVYYRRVALGAVGSAAAEMAMFRENKDWRTEVERMVAYYTEVVSLQEREVGSLELLLERAQEDVDEKSLEMDAKDEVIMTLRGIERSYQRFLAKTSQDLTALQNERQRSTDSVGVQTDPIIPNDCHELSIAMGIPARVRPFYTISETLPPTPRVLSPEFPEDSPSYSAIPLETIPSDKVMSNSSGSGNGELDDSDSERYILLGYNLTS
jgi:hypothetical protein